MNGTQKMVGLFLFVSLAFSESGSDHIIDASRYSAENRTQAQLANDFLTVSNTDTLLQQRQAALQRYSAPALRTSLEGLLSAENTLNAICIEKRSTTTGLIITNTTDTYRNFRATFLTSQPNNQSLRMQIQGEEDSTHFSNGSVESRSYLPIHLYPRGTPNEPMLSYHTIPRDPRAAAYSYVHRLSILSRNADNEFQIILDSGRPGGNTRTKVICRAITARR